MNDSAATALPAATASRLRRPSWRDWRLLVGLLLMLAAVAAGARVVALADQTVPVFATRSALPAGTSLSGDVLTVARVRVTGTDARYLDARAGVPAGHVLLRSLGPGEIVPVSAVGTAAQLSTRPVAIPLEGVPPAGLVAGGRVDVWASERERATGDSVRYAAPRLLAGAVDVYHVAAAGGSLSAGRTATVEVLLDEQELPLVLDALANDARTAIVPVPGDAAPAGTS